MDLDAVMTEIATALDTITGLRLCIVGEKPVPPAAWVSYPENITFDLTYGRGEDSMDLQIVLIVGKVNDRSTRTALAAYCKGSGASSVKAAVDGGTYTAADVVRVTEADFDVVTLAGVDHMAAIFSVHVSGNGA